jgi:hypothetical protein
MSMPDPVSDTKEDPVAAMRIPGLRRVDTYGDSLSRDVPGDRLILVSGPIGSGPDGTIATVADVIKITARVVDFDDDFPIYSQACRTAFEEGPASLAPGASDVPGPRFEIPAAAFAPADSRLGR